jgi:hypothetical protein
MNGEPLLEATNPAHLVAARAVLAKAAAEGFPTSSDALDFSATLVPVQPRMKALPITAENIAVVCLAYEGEMHISMQEFSARIATGVDHTFAIGDYIVEIPTGVFPVGYEDIDTLWKLTTETNGPKK